MKFAIAQEVSRHVRDKACKFYTKAATATATSTSAVGLDLIETNFSDILSPSTFAGNVAEENEFGMIIGELEGEGDDEQVVEISFACKLCDFR